MPHPQILAFGYHFFLGENKCWGVGVCGGGGGGWGGVGGGAWLLCTVSLIATK